MKLGNAELYSMSTEVQTRTLLQLLCILHGTVRGSHLFVVYE